MDDVDFFNADNHKNNKETETSILYGCGQVWPVVSRSIENIHLCISS